MSARFKGSMSDYVGKNKAEFDFYSKHENAVGSQSQPNTALANINNRAYPEVFK